MSSNSFKANSPPETDVAAGDASSENDHDRIAALVAENQSLRLTLEAYELLDSASLELMAIVDKNGIYKFVNKVYERAYGLPQSKIVGRHMSDIIHGDVYERTLKPYLERAFKGATISFQEWFSHPGLGHTFREVVCVPMDECCNLGDVIIYSIDVTKRMETEQEVRSRDEEYRNLVELMLDGVAITNSEGVLLHANPRFSEILDRETDEVVGSKLVNYLDEKSAERFRLHQAVRRKGVLDDYQISITKKDGGKRILRARALARYDDSDNFIGSLLIISDITLRIRAEKAFRESLRFSRSILDSLLSHVVVLDENGDITMVNKAWQEFAQNNGVETSAVEVGANYLQQCRRALKSDDPETAANGRTSLDGIRSVLKGETSFFSMEYPCHSPDELRWFMMRVSPLQTEAGGVVITHMDVTEERLAKEELQQTRDRLEELVQERTKELASANAQLQSAYHELLRTNETLQNEIVQRNKVEKDLADSQHRYQMLFANAADGILTFDDQGLVQNMNRQLEKMLQRPAEELTGVHVRSLVDPEDLQKKPLQLPKLVAGENIRSERTLILPDGSKLPVEINSRRVADNYILAIMRDISEKKRAEETLRLSEERYKSLFENNIMVMLLVEPNSGVIIDANQAACDYYGAPREGLQKHSLTDITIEEASEMLNNLSTSIRNTGHRFHCSHQRADGEIRDLEMFSGPHNVNDHELVLIVVHDITRRTRAEALVREKEALLQHILSLMKIGIFVIDQENRRIQDFNTVAESMFTLPPREEVLGSDAQALLFPMLHDANTHDGLNENNLHGEKSRNLELFLTQSGGPSFPVLFNAFPMFQQEKKKTILTFLDISERKELEQQLSHAQKMESIGQLAAGIAHEINTPAQYVSDNMRFIQESFSDILGLVDRLTAFFEQNKNEHGEGEASQEIDELADEVEIDFLRDEVPKALDQSLEGLNRISSIVMAMKKFSHPGETGMKHMDINDALENTIVVSRNEWKYVADVETDLDKSMEPVLCFPDDLNQVFLNVIVNASHAIAEKVEGTSDKGQIRIATHDRGSFVEIDISDSGTGIPESHRARLFDPFFTTKKVGKGTGQGLAISYSLIVDKHRGEIFFDSVEGEGTTFHIRIPKSTKEDS
eukprot:TRINITY_DN1687_c1_g1_i1.p1 TRINITY_DN1687_c1_g1~~TRINITY_DN1687_c1_g1_i1.p1  ORF type:complete len:1127 (+),score=285.61 TRINITY_DN1687_c1_g1_i1:17924-21304(+)